MDDMERETTDRTSGPMAAAQETTWEGRTEYVYQADL